MSIIKSEIEINEIPLLKFRASNKITELIDAIKDSKNEKMKKTASSNIDVNALITLFSNMLNTLNLKSSSEKEDIENIIQKISTTNISTKTSKDIDSSKHDEIKIVSKHIKDSHYQIDVSKDVISHRDSKIFMISCYARDAYLGRYLIKRNFYYNIDRQNSANAAYDEIITKMNALKERYYNDIIDVSALSTQMKKILDGVYSEITLAED